MSCGSGGTSWGGGPAQIINLNVGGTKFSTSKQTLIAIPDTFFTSMLSGRINTHKDESGAIFIDRDPQLFRTILNYLRNKTISVEGMSSDQICQLKHEAEFYSLSPLLRKLTLCTDLHTSGCGDVLFYAYLPAPCVPAHETVSPLKTTQTDRPPNIVRLQDGLSSMGPSRGHVAASHATAGHAAAGHAAAGHAAAGHAAAGHATAGHSRNSSLDLRRSHSRNSSGEYRLSRPDRPPPPIPSSHPHLPSSHPYVPSPHPHNIPSSANSHSRNSSTDLKMLENYNPWMDPLKVISVTAHHNCLAVAYRHFVAIYKLKESCGFQLAFTSPYLEHDIARVAINTKMAALLPSIGLDQVTLMIAVACGSSVRLMGFSEDGTRTDIGAFNLQVTVDNLFFIGAQLVALSPTGRIGVWNSLAQHWQSQELAPITAHDTAGSFLLLGSSNGSINYIDMQKFPLRMKDNDLLVTELYRDPAGDSVTAISVYLTPKTSLCGNWIEIAYGTTSGRVRVIVQHPETVGHGPQLFQTFTVHRSPVTKVTLSEKYLVSVCAEYNHVRTWNVTRFRGMISTQPGSTPLASFKIVSLEEDIPRCGGGYGNDIGPYGDQDDEQVFIQKLVPESESLLVRLASRGNRVCEIRSVDGSNITSFCVHECEGSSRMGSRPRRFIFTGHACGAIQMWDLTTALDFYEKDEPTFREGGPSPPELLRQLDSCELTNSRCSTPCISPSPSFTPHAALAAKAKAYNLNESTTE